jgi:hypothetical protein
MDFRFLQKYKIKIFTGWAAKVSNENKNKKKALARIGMSSKALILYKI